MKDREHATRKMAVRDYVSKKSGEGDKDEERKEV